MTSAPLPQSSLPRLPLDLLLLISSYTTLSTLSTLSRTCRILHTHLASRLRKSLILSKAAPYLSNHDLYNLVLTCSSVHTLLTPVFNSAFVAATETFINYTANCRLYHTPRYWSHLPYSGRDTPETSINDLDPNTSYRGPSLLYYAAKNGFTEEVRALLELGVEAHRDDTGFGTPLSRAVAGGYVEIVQMLVEGGAGRRGSRGGIGGERGEEIKSPPGGMQKVAFADSSEA